MSKDITPTGRKSPERELIDKAAIDGAGPNKLDCPQCGHHFEIEDMRDGPRKLAAMHAAAHSAQLQQELVRLRAQHEKTKRQLKAQADQYSVNLEKRALASQAEQETERKLKAQVDQYSVDPGEGGKVVVVTRMLSTDHRAKAIFPPVLDEALRLRVRQLEKELTELRCHEARKIVAVVPSAINEGLRMQQVTLQEALKETNRKHMDASRDYWQAQKSLAALEKLMHEREEHHKALHRERLAMIEEAEKDAADASTWMSITILLLTFSIMVNISLVLTH